jgi:chorismate synthase
MSVNTFGRVLRMTTWGESHGPALGAIVDGCPPGLALAETDIQPFLDARKPGQSKFTTQRKEADLVKILSGTFEGRTTGTPIALQIENTDQRSKDYSEVAKAYRPGPRRLRLRRQVRLARLPRRRAQHGARDRGAGGGGRCRAAGDPRGDDHRLRQRDRRRRDRPRGVRPGADRREPRSSAPTLGRARWEKLVDEARKDGSSLGAVVECVATGVPPGGARRSTASSTPTSPRR